MKIKSNIRIVFWNANGIEHKITELTDFLQEEGIDVALLGETYLRPNKNLKIQNYNTYRTDRTYLQETTFQKKNLMNYLRRKHQLSQQAIITQSIWTGTAK